MARLTRAARRSLHRSIGRQHLGSLKPIEVAHRTLQVSFPTLDILFKWMAERDRIRKKRSAGKPPPWSQDPIFNSHKFCHVFRIFDRVSQFLLHKVINKGCQEHREICFRVILFKLFNRISTWNALQKRLGPLTWAAFDLNAYGRVLTRVAQDNPIYTSAYQIPAPNLVGGPGFKSHLRVLQMMMEDDLPGKLLSCKGMQDAYELIKVYPGMGQFLSYQMVLDLNMTPEINYSENGWAVCGPGSEDCLNMIFGPRVRGIETEAIEYLYKTQTEHYTRLHITDPPTMSAERPGVSFVDIEHSLCECSKYLKRRNQKGNWQASNEPVTNDLPAKWGQEPEVYLSKDISSSPLTVDTTDDEDITTDTDSDEDTYEVSHIVRERRRKSRSGDLEYQIRWMGYGPDEDTWMSEDDLKNAPEVLKEWRAQQPLRNETNRRVAKTRSSNHRGRKAQSQIRKLRLRKSRV